MPRNEVLMPPRRARSGGAKNIIIGSSRPGTPGPPLALKLPPYASGSATIAPGCAHGFLGLCLDQPQTDRMQFTAIEPTTADCGAAVLHLVVAALGAKGAP